MTNQPSIPNPLQEFVQSPKDYAVHHWRDEVTFAENSPHLFLFSVFFTFIAAWFVFRFFHRRELDRIPILTTRIDGYIEDQARRDREIAERDKEIAKLKKQLSTPSPNSSYRVFDIECLQKDLNWRENGGKEQYPILPNVTASSSATFVLAVQALVHTIPSLLVQSIELEIRGIRIPEENWKSQLLKSETRVLYFPIPSSLSLGDYSVRIIATIPKNGSEIEECKFSPFDIRIARSYEELHK